MAGFDRSARAASGSRGSVAAASRRARRRAVVAMAAAGAAGLLARAAPRASAANLVWDPAQTTTNGALGTPGSGTWDLSTTNWYDPVAGALTTWTQTSPTVGLNTAVFAGGVDAAGDTYNVSLGTALACTSLVFNNSGYVLTAPTATTLSMNTGAGIFIASGKVASIGANVGINYTTFSQLEIGQGTNSNAASGTLNIETGASVVDAGGRTFAVGGSGTVVNLSGVMATTGASGVGSAAISLAQIAGSTATVNVLAGGNLSSGYTGTTPGLFIGNQGAATLNVAAGGQVNVVSTAVNGVLFGNATLIANAPNGNVLNLNGGTVTTPAVAKGAGTAPATFNFNGGTLLPNKNNATFMTGLTAANVMAGGALINTNGFNVSIGQALLASTTSTGGGLSKLGLGMLALTGTNTFTGATSVTGGTLALSGTGSINPSGGIGINGAGAKFLQLSTVASTPAVTLTNGTLDGVGSVGAVTVGAGTGGIVTNGNGSTGTLTMSALTFLGAATDNVVVAGGSSFAVPGQVVTAALTTPATAGAVTLNVTAASLVNGTYDLIQYGSLAGGGLSGFALGTTTGLAASQTAMLGTSGGYVTLIIGGAVDRFTGADSNVFQVGSTGANHNFKLSTGAGTPIDYTDGDAVLFDDTANAANVALNLGSNVNPSSVTFNTSSLAYSISSTGGYGIGGTGGLIKNGSANLTINTSNTYIGGTTINGGVVTVSNVNNLGAATGSVTVNAGTLEVAGTIASTRNFFLGSPTSTVQVDPTFSYTTSGTVADVSAGSPGTLNVTGGGTLNLTGATSYSGGTNVTGSSTLTAANNLGAANTAVAVAAGSTVSFSGGTVTNAITGAGAVTNTNVTTVTGNETGFTGTWTAVNQFSLNGTANASGVVPTTSANAAYVDNFANNTNGFILGTSGTYQLGSLSGVAGSTVRGGNTVNAPVVVSVGSLNTNTVFAGTLANNASTTATTTLALVKVGTGSLTLSGPSSYTGGTNVSAGTLVASFNTSVGLGSVSVGPAGLLQVGANASGGRTVLYVNGLSLPGTAGPYTGKVDVAGNDLDLPGASLSTVNAMVAQGFANGAWTGKGITSSTAAADTAHLTAVGVIQNNGSTGTAIYGDGTTFPLFDKAAVGASDVLVKYTYYGDVNLDGVVNAADYTIVDAGFVLHLTGWANGDLNYDGVVDGSDYTLMDNAFNQQTTALSAAVVASPADLVATSSAVPEPTTFGLLGIALTGLLGRRRRRA